MRETWSGGWIASNPDGGSSFIGDGGTEVIKDRTEINEGVRDISSESW